GPEDAFCGSRDPLVELRRDVLRSELKVDLEEAPQTPGLEVARPGEQLFTVPDERLRVEHRRVLEDATAGVQQPRVMSMLRGGAGPVVGIRRDEQAHPYSTAGGALDAPD